MSKEKLNSNVVAYEGNEIHLNSVYKFFIMTLHIKAKKIGSLIPCDPRLYQANECVEETGGLQTQTLSL